MNGVHHPRLGTAKARRASRKKSPAHRARTPASATPRLLTFTVDSQTGRIVKLEASSPRGSRRELSAQEKAALKRECRNDSLEDVLERAFEAGIGCVLGADSREDGRDETDEEAQLRHLLLTRLIEHSPARNLMRREVLSRAIIGSLIQDSFEPSGEGSTREPSAQAQDQRTAPAVTH
jgi:hypothetical protein